jgi:fructokinase
MNKHKNLLIFGEVLFDCFEDGNTVLGGAPFNVAWHLQAFGCAPLFVSRIGDDELGEKIRQSMETWGMDTSGLQRDSTHPTGTVQVKLIDDEPHYEIVPNRAWDFIDARAIPDVSPGLIYHGSLALRSPRSAGALQTLKDTSAATVFMDINLRPPWWEKVQLEKLVADAAWVKLNEHELRALVHADDKVDGAAGDDMQMNAANLIDRYNLQLAIVTKGAAGAFAMDGNGAVFDIAPAGSNTVVDTVGAGDAFASVCILGLVRGWSVDTMLPRAQAFASAVVGQRGATIADRAFYEPLLRQWHLEN